MPAFPFGTHIESDLDQHRLLHCTLRFHLHSEHICYAKNNKPLSVGKCLHDYEEAHLWVFLIYLSGVQKRSPQFNVLLIVFGWISLVAFVKILKFLKGVASCAVDKHYLQRCNGLEKIIPQLQLWLTDLSSAKLLHRAHNLANRCMHSGFSACCPLLSVKHKTMFWFTLIFKSSTIPNHLTWKRYIMQLHGGYPFLSVKCNSLVLPLEQLLVWCVRHLWNISPQAKNTLLQ